MNICTNQFDQNQESFRNVCTLYTTEQEIVVTRISQDQLSVYIVYKSIDEQKTDSAAQLETVDEMIDDQSNSYDGYMDELDLVFKATISTKGTLLSLESPNGEQPDTTIRLTERLIQQTFPELDPALYNTPYALRSSQNRRRRVLQEMSAEEIEQLPTQETYLGEVSAEYTFNVDHSGNTILQKQYTDYDFVNYSYDLGGDKPDVKYNSLTVVNDQGIINSNEEIMHFNITDPTINNSQGDYEEMIGLISVQVESSMVVNHVRESDDELLEGIRKYEENNAFSTVDLASDGGLLNISSNNDTVKLETGEKPLLGASAIYAYTKDISVFKKSIFKQSVEMKIIQDNYEIYSDVSAAIFLNDKKIADLYTLRVNHPWLACQSSKSGSGSNFDKNFKIFEVQFPILGIITIPVRAYINVQMGWSFNVAPAAEICNISFQTYARPSITAEGGISIIKIAEGGVTARGSVANGYFNFNLGVNRKLFQATLDINAQLIPFEYSVDVYYRYFRCDFKSLFKRNLRFGKIFKKIVKVVKVVTNIVKRITHICGLSNPKYINITKGQVGSTQTLNIYKTIIPFKNRS
ncbi:hypothetical protein ABPG74_003725 [Tetrahymena malaccensis]